MVCTGRECCLRKAVFKGNLMQTAAREGDIVQSVDDVFFDVKGLMHPPERIIAFIRFFPDASGDRILGKIRYSKVYSLDERFRLLKEKFSQYLFYDPGICLLHYICDIRDLQGEGVYLPFSQYIPYLQHL